MRKGRSDGREHKASPIRGKSDLVTAEIRENQTLLFPEQATKCFILQICLQYLYSIQT